MSLSLIFKVAVAVLLIGVFPLFVFAQRDKSSAQRAAQIRQEQAMRKEKLKQEAARAAAKEADKKTRAAAKQVAKKEQAAAKAAASQRKAEEIQATKTAKIAAAKEKLAAKQQPKQQKVEPVEEKNKPAVAVAEPQPEQPASRKQPTDNATASLDRVVETDLVPTIDLKTKSDGSTVGNLMALFSEISGSKKSKSNTQLMPKAQKLTAEKGTFEGIKVYRMFIRHTSGFIEKFHYVKEFQTPPANIDELYYYNKLTGKITMRNPLETGMTTFDKENFLLLHGPYVKIKGDQTYEEGSFYLGAKHGRWEKFDKNFVLLEKLYFNKGMAKDAQVVYENDAKGNQRIKEIVPLQHGLKHGTYIAYYPSGRIAARGQYTEGCKTGRWTEYYDRDHNPRRKEIIYPRRPHDDTTQPYTSREWDESGKLITDVRK